MKQTTKQASDRPLRETVQPSTSVNPFGGRVDAGTASQPGYRNRSGLSLAFTAGQETDTAPSAVTRAA